MLRNLFFTTVALASIFALAQAGRLGTQECSNGPSLATNVVVSSVNFTDGTSLAQLTKGQTYTMTVSFRITNGFSSLDTKVFALIAGLEVAWNNISPITCNFLISGSCPFVPGQTYVYQNSFTVLASYPSVSLTILWRIRHPGTTTNEVCFQLPAVIS